jgi:hypothetical protein
MAKNKFLSEDMFEAMGDYPLEYRICHLLLWFCAVDGELSEEEITGVAAYVQGVIDALGVDSDVEEVLTGCLQDISDDPNTELLEETIEIFADYFPDEKLAELVNGIEDVVSLDELSDDEAEFLTHIRDSWGVEEKPKQKSSEKKSVVKKKKKSK